MSETVCGKCGVEVKFRGNKVEVSDDKFNARKKKIPFHCRVCGALQFPVKAIRDVVFLWPDPLPIHVNPDSKLIIPDVFRKYYKNDFGYVLSAGPGYQKDGECFRASELKAGDRVVYDKSTPWKHPIEDQEGKVHQIRMMGARDVKAILEDEE